MAGTVTVTPQTARNLVRRYSLAWTSDAAGAVNGTLTDYITGELARVVFIPNSGGTQPTNNYVMTLVATDGLDLLANQGAALSNVTTTHICPGAPLKDGTTTTTRPVAIDDKLELKITGAGNAKSGTLVLYIK